MPVQVPPNPLGEAASPASALARIADLEGEIRRLREVASLTAKTTPSHDAGGDVPEVKLVPNQKIVVAASKK